MPKPPSIVLARPGRSGEPRIAHDPLSLGDLLVWERMDSHANGFIRPNYGDTHPGWQDPKTGAALYTTFQCVAIQELDRQFIEVCYRKLPPTWFYRWPSYSNVPLPDVLDSLSGTYNLGSNEGSSSHPASQQEAFITGAGSVSENPKARAQSGASIMPELSWKITSPWSRVLADNWTFLLENPVTIAQVLGFISVGIGAKATTVTISHASPAVVSWTANGLSNGNTVAFSTTGTLPAPLQPLTAYYVVSQATNTIELSLTPGGAAINTTTAGSGVHTGVLGVNQFPTFQPSSTVISGFGQQASVSVDAESNAYYGRDSTGANQSGGFDYGNGESFDLSTTNRTWNIPPTIHGALTISGSNIGGLEESVSATVDASTEAILVGGTTVIDAISNTLTGTANANGAFGPTTLAATSPAAIPSAGLYLVGLTPSIYSLDELIMIHAEVVDFSVFAGI